MSETYLNNWSSREEMAQDFDLTGSELDGANVLLASYGTPAYEGYAFVIFERSGKLYEVNGSHCSCYGLEGQWQPEETSADALRHRIEHGNLGDGNYDSNPFAAELTAVLNGLTTPAFMERAE
jgi:hypothetical protein